MPTELFHHGGHRCLMFTDLCSGAADAVQSNQFLIVDDGTGAVIDPGGNLAYSELYRAMTRYFPPSALIASHADPDIIAALDRWTTATQAKIYISTVWERFVPHFCKPGKTTGRVVSGDLGVSMRSGQQSAKPVSSLAPLLPAMIGFHRRYRVSNKILRLWADMVSGLKINMIAPQHGAPLVGAAVGEFIDWARGLHCGIDLMGPTDHQVPA